MTPIELIDETVEFYSVNPIERRSVVYIKSTGDPNGTMPRCRYNGKNGTHCAVGRCVKDPTKLVEGLSVVDYSKINILDGDKQALTELDTILKDEYLGMPPGFWSQLQLFHDNSDFWTDTGLSENGVYDVRFMKERFS